MKSRIELGHFCGRNKQSDWLLLPPRNELRAFIATAANSSHWCQGRESEDAQDVEMDGFEALIAYAAHTRPLSGIDYAAFPSLLSKTLKLSAVQCPVRPDIEVVLSIVLAVGDAISG